MPPVKDLTVNITENITRYITEVITQIINQVPGSGGGGGGGGGGNYESGIFGPGAGGNSGSGGGGDNYESGIFGPGAGMYFATGGKVKRNYMATGGPTLGSDTVSAMLTPGEFVMNRAATARFEPLLSAMNQGGYTGFETQRYRVSNKNSVVPAGSTQISTTVNNNNTPVYNYSLSVNVNGNSADPNNIANTVMTRLRQMQNSDIRRQVV